MIIAKYYSILFVLLLTACGKERPASLLLPTSEYIRQELQKQNQDGDIIPDGQELKGQELILNYPEIYVHDVLQSTLTLTTKDNKTLSLPSIGFAPKRKGVWAEHLTQFHSQALHVLQNEGAELALDAALFEKDNIFCERVSNWSDQDFYPFQEALKTLEANQVARIDLALKLKMQADWPQGNIKIKNIRGRLAFRNLPGVKVKSILEIPLVKNDNGQELEIGTKGAGNILSLHLAGLGAEALIQAISNRQALELCLSNFDFELQTQKYSFKALLASYQSASSKVIIKEDEHASLYFVKAKTHLSQLATALERRQKTDHGQLINWGKFYAHEYALPKSLAEDGAWLLEDLAKPLVNFFPLKVLSQEKHELEDKNNALFISPVRDILIARHFNFSLTASSATDNLTMSHVIPGEVVELELSGQESIPTVGNQIPLDQLAMVTICEREREPRDHLKAWVCNDVEGWCGVYYRNLEWQNHTMTWTAQQLKGILVNGVGSSSQQANFFLSGSQPWISPQQVVNFRLKVPAFERQTGVQLHLSQLYKDYNLQYGHSGYRACEHRNLGRNFHFLGGHSETPLVFNGQNSVGLQLKHKVLWPRTN